MKTEIERFIPPEVTAQDDRKAGVPGFQPGLVGSLVRPPAPPPVVEKPAPPVEVVKTYTEQELAASRTSGFEEGYAKGYDAAKSQSEELDRQIMQSLEKTLGQLQQLAVNVEQHDQKTARELTQLAMVMARKVTGAVLEEIPLVNIEATIQKTMHLLFDEPKITIYINPELVGNVIQRVARLAKKEGFSGDIDIQGRETVAKGDCEVQWRGGGLKNNKADVWRDIEKICGV